MKTKERRYVEETMRFTMTIPKGIKDTMTNLGEGRGMSQSGIVSELCTIFFSKSQDQDGGDVTKEAIPTYIKLEELAKKSNMSVVEYVKLLLMDAIKTQTVFRKEVVIHREMLK